jgi:uncharacterized protein (DUF2147 family)
MRLSKLVLLGLLATFAFARAAIAAEPYGDWLVAEKTAQIRILDCAGALWGVVAWEKDPGGVDEKNPDARKRSRPTLGMPIMLGMKPVKDGWDGPIYNSENGKTYSGGVRMNNNGTLHIFGCVLYILCGGEDWTRAAAPAAGGLQTSGQALCEGLREN